MVCASAGRLRSSRAQHTGTAVGGVDLSLI